MYTEISVSIGFYERDENLKVNTPTNKPWGNIWVLLLEYHELVLVIVLVLVTQTPQICRLFSHFVT